MSYLLIFLSILKSKLTNCISTSFVDKSRYKYSCDSKRSDRTRRLFPSTTFELPKIARTNERDETTWQAVGNVSRIISSLIWNFAVFARKDRPFTLDARERACPSIPLPATRSEEAGHKCDLRPCSFRPSSLRLVR